MIFVSKQMSGSVLLHRVVFEQTDFDGIWTVQGVGFTASSNCNSTTATSTGGAVTHKFLR